MIQLIKKGGLRERANRSHRYQASENIVTTLNPNRYDQTRVSTQHEDAQQTPSNDQKPRPDLLK
jgi:hypothetical protein